MVEIGEGKEGGGKGWGKKDGGREGEGEGVRSAGVGAGERQGNGCTSVGERLEDGLGNLQLLAGKIGQTGVHDSHLNLADIDPYFPDLFC